MLPDIKIKIQHETERELIHPQQNLMKTKEPAVKESPQPANSNAAVDSFQKSENTSLVNKNGARIRPINGSASEGNDDNLVSVKEEESSRGFTESLPKSMSIRGHSMGRARSVRSRVKSFDANRVEEIEVQEEKFKWQDLWMSKSHEHLPGDLTGQASHINFFNKEDTTSRDFIDSTAYNIPLDTLYKFEKCIATNEANDLCVVIHLIKAKELKKLVGMNNKYELQVWNKRGQCVYSRYFKELPRKWALFQNVLVWVCQDSSLEVYSPQDNQVITLVHFGTNKVNTIHRIKVSDLEIDQIEEMAYFQHRLFLSVDTSAVGGEEKTAIYQIDCEKFLDRTYDEPTITQEAASPKYLFDTQEAFPEKTMFQGFLDMGQTILDADDNVVEIKERLILKFEHDLAAQLRYFEVSFQEADKELGGISLKSLNSGFQENQIDDHQDIKKQLNLQVRNAQTKKLIHVASVLRGHPDSDEGQVDLYYNFRKVDTLEGFYLDIDASFQIFYFLQKQAEGQKLIKKCPTEWKEMMGESVTTDILAEKEATTALWWSRNKHYAVKQYMKLYQCYLNLQSLIIIAHGRFLSIYELCYEQWMHLELPDQIVNMEANYSSLEGEDSNKRQLNCILASGKIATVNFTNNLPQSKEYPLGVKIHSTDTFNPPGRVVQYVMATELNSSCFLLCDTDNKCLDNSQAIFSTQKQLTKHEDASSSILRPSPQAKSLQFYQFANGLFDKPYLEDKPFAPNTQIIYQQQCTNTVREIYLLQEEVRLVRLSFSLDDKNEYLSDPETPPQIVSLGKYGNKEGIYSGAKKMIAVIRPTTTDYKKYWRFMVGDGDIYVVEAVESEDGGKMQLKVRHRTHQRNLTAVIAMGEDFIYGLSDGYHELTKTNAGVTEKGDYHIPALYCIDGGQQLKRQIDNTTMIRDSLCGMAVSINCNANWDRFAYLRNYDVMELIPIPHTNIIEFIGMPPTRQILASRHEKGTFTILRINGDVMTWSVLNAKMVKDNKPIDFTEYLSAGGVQRNLADFKLTDDPIQTFEEHTFSVIKYNPKASLDKKGALPNTGRTKRPLQKLLSFEVQEKERTSFFALLKMKTQDVDVAFVFHFPDGDREKNVFTFSPDTTRLLNTLDDGQAKVYRREWVDEDKRIAKWELLHEINNLPESFLVTDHNFMFTPNFDFYLTVDMKNEEFVIKSTATGKIYQRIPKSLYNTAVQGQKNNMRGVIQLVKQMILMNDHQIRVLTQDGIDCIYNYVTEKTESFCKVDNWSRTKQYKHFYLDQEQVDFTAVTKRLVACATEFRMESGRMHELEQQALNEKDPRKRQNIWKQVEIKLSQKLYKGSRGKNTTHDSEVYAAEHCFTLLDWLRIEKLAEDQFYDYKALTNPQLFRIAFNILPGQRTILHYLAKNKEGVKLDLCRAIFEAGEKVQEELGVRVYYPLIRDASGTAPVGIALQGNFYSQNFVELYMDKIKDYPIFFFGRQIQHALEKCITNRHDGLKEFFDSRLLKYGHFQNQLWQKNNLRKDKKIRINKDRQVTLATISPWQDRTHTRSELFEEQEKVFQRREISTRLVDIPDLHLPNNQVAINFMNALANSKDITLFSSLTIQTIITHRWKHILSTIYLTKLVPYVIYFLSFQIWSVFIVPELGKPDEQTGKGELFLLILSGISIFFILQQIYLLYRLSSSYDGGYKIYFRSIWNYVDLIPAFLMLSFVSARMSGSSNTVFTKRESNFMSAVSLALWIKALYFLRIKPWSAFLVRMIFQCIMDVRVFGAIFLFSILAFANSFYILGRQLFPAAEGEEASRLLADEVPSFKCTPEEPAAPMFANYFQAVMYTYKTSMGDWDTDAFGENNNSVAFLWVFWVGTTTIALIVLLNLLIAIVSETFGEIMATAEENNYQEKAKIIRDLQSTRIVKIKAQERFLCAAYAPYLKTKEAEVILVQCSGRGKGADKMRP